MSKQIEEQIKKDAAAADIDPETAAAVYRAEGEQEAPAVPFVEPAPAPAAMPSAAQHEWLRQHPDYTRSSHHYGNMINRGTLYVDGTFVPESKHPVMDGPGCFGVGVALRR